MWAIATDTFNHSVCKNIQNHVTQPSAVPSFTNMV